MQISEWWEFVALAIILFICTLISYSAGYSTGKDVGYYDGVEKGARIMKRICDELAYYEKYIKTQRREKE